MRIRSKPGATPPGVPSGLETRGMVTETRWSPGIAPVTAFEAFVSNRVIDLEIGVADHLVAEIEPVVDYRPEAGLGAGWIAPHLTDQKRIARSMALPQAWPD